MGRKRGGASTVGMRVSGTAAFVLTVICSWPPRLRCAQSAGVRRAAGGAASVARFRAVLRDHAHRCARPASIRWRRHCAKARPMCCAPPISRHPDACRGRRANGGHPRRQPHRAGSRQLRFRRSVRHGATRDSAPDMLPEPYRLSPEFVAPVTAPPVQPSALPRPAAVAEASREARRDTAAVARAGGQACRAQAGRRD